MGDEGSGCFFGKKLIRDYFYKKLPPHIAFEFEKEFELTSSELVRKVYSEPNANVYLASFTRFISRFQDEPHINDWLVSGFKEFIDIHIKCFPQWREVEVHFIGSVAFYFEKALRESCASEGVQFGTIIKKPIDNLVAYHTAALKY